MRISRLLLLVLSVFVTAAHADQWMLPVPETFTSDNGVFRLTVFPRELSGQLAYFEGIVDGEAAPGQAPTDVTKSEATLERLVENKYVSEWRMPLVNDVAPVSALVSGRNGSFVTFDNWHSAGYGDDAIVIYDASGNLVKKYALTDLMTEEEFENLPRSVSSIHWSGDHHLYDNREFDFVQLEIKLEWPTGETKSRSKTVYLRMSDGEAISKPESVHW
mgnify:CR=1 FL=1|tara:strand:+ start:623 stop:1276 length:654 start_codon:yes stop_codon:yes gene_type:complete